MIKFGNHKLPTDTAICSMSSATNCPAYRRGLCQAVIAGRCVCYGRRTETYRPQAKVNRDRSGMLWRASSAEHLAGYFVLSISARKAGGHNVRALRFNEAGDFGSQADIGKAEHVAAMLRQAFGRYFRTYCYTARSDLDYSGCTALVVNASGRWTRPGIRGQFIMLQPGERAPRGAYVCKGNCRRCRRCAMGKVTYTPAKG